MQVNDTVLLKGRVVKTQDNTNYQASPHTASLVVFENDEDKTHRFIEYWFNDVFLTKDEAKISELKEEFKKMFADEVYGIEPGQPIFRFRENHETLAEDVFRWIMEKLYE